MALSTDQFRDQLIASGLLTAQDLSALLASLPDDKQPQDGEQLARELVRQKKLTKFQAEQIYVGKGKALVLGNYTILDKLGQGGMGMVLKAEHRRMKRLVAIKVMSPQAVKTPDALKRFHREVEAAAKLRHPNIVAADDADEAKGTHFLVMEYVEGSDLSVLVKKNGPFPVDQAVRCIIQAAKGLEYAHKRGVVHRDIKPANLLLDKEGTVKILDMGLARIDDSVGGSSEGAGLTSTGTIMGTVDYMSPEQAMDTKHADARSDIYSLGCSLYYLLTGKCLYDGDTIMKKLMAHQHAPIPELRSPVAPRQESRTSLDSGSSMTSSEVDDASAFVSRSDTATLKALDAVFRRMVAKKPEDRPQSMTQVIAELERCLAGGSPTVAFERSGSSATHVAASGASGSGNELQQFLQQFSDEASTSATSVAPAGSKGTAVAPSSGEAETMISSADGAGTDPRTEQTMTLEQVGQHFGEPMGVSPRTARGQTPSGSPSHRMKLLIGSVAAVVVLVAILFAVSGNRGQKESPRSKTEVAKRVGDAPSQGVSSSTPIQAVKDPDRDVAKWVIETGGSVNVNVNVGGQGFSRLTTVAELPKESFTVEGVRFLQRPSLTAADVERLVALSKLAGIVLELTPPTADAVRAMKNLRQLRYFTLADLGNNRTSDEAFAAVTELRQLDAMLLTSAPIPDEFFARVGQLSRLRSLDLREAKPLSAAQFELLAANPPKRLGSMNLSGTTMTQAGLAALARLPHLVRLDLSRSNLDDDMLSALHSSKSLSIVHVRDTAVSRKGTDRLVAANGVCVVADPASLPSHIDAQYWQTAQTLLSRGFGFSTCEREKYYPPKSTLPPQAEPITHVLVPPTATLDDLKSLATLKDLTNFHLWDGTLPAGAIQVLEPLSNLTRLSAGPLPSGDFVRLKNFPKLVDFGAQFPDDTAVATIASLPHLTDLGLSPGSQITDACLTSLLDAPILTKLVCFAQPISRAAIVSFVAARPDVDVIWNGETFNASAPEPPRRAALTPYEILTSPDYEWTPPENLGPTVNTGAADQWPALSADGLRLIFHSWGRGGLCESTRSSLDEPFGIGEWLGPEFEGGSAGSGTALSGDGLTLVFGSGRPGGLGDADLWQATRPNLSRPFGKPVCLTALNSSAYDANPTLSSDGLTIWFQSDRPGRQNGARWTSRRSSLTAEFGRPVTIAVPLVPDVKHYSQLPGISISADQRVLIFSPVFDKATPDLFMSVRPTPKASFGTPASLGLPKDSEASDTEPSLSADGLTLVFASNRLGGLGDPDLWMTRRVRKAKKPTPYEILTSPDYEWTPPENLGPTVNTHAADQWPALSADGLRLIFHSFHRADTGLSEATRTRIDEPFGQAQPLGEEFSKNTVQGGTTLSGDGLILVFGSAVRPGGPGEPGNINLWQATRPDLLSPFSKPVCLTALSSNVDDIHPWLSSDGLTIWFNSHRPNALQGDYWTSRRASREAEFEPPIPVELPLLPGVSHYHTVSGLALSSDERVLIFAPSYHLEGRGTFNLLMCVRPTRDAKFGTPVNLGPVVNSEHGDLSPTLSADGTVLVFCSVRPGSLGTSPDGDLWMTRRVPKSKVEAPLIDAPKPAIAPFDAQQARTHQEAWAKHLGVPVEYTNSIGMKFMLIPPGEFTMGSTLEEIEAALKERGDKHWQDCVKSEAPQHKVILTQPIYLGVNEVTQAEYEKVMGKNPSSYSPTGKNKEAVAGLDTTRHPVEAVNWIDAAEFCAKLSQQEKLKPFYFRAGLTITPLDGTGYRLPSEADWEFACRAGTISKFWSGDNDRDLAQAGWFQGNSGGRTHAVGELKANPFGLFDIHGNAWEWVQDGWDATWYDQFRESPAINPATRFDSAAAHVVRGGSRSQSASNTRSSLRYARSPSALGPEFGFRVSLPVDAVRRAVSVPPTDQKTGDNPPARAKSPFDAQQARAHQEAWAKHLGTTVETTNSVGAKMILIPPAEFLMGSSDEQIKLATKIAEETLEPSLKGRIAEERPQHLVRITKPFRLGAHEVTIGQFAKFAEQAKYKSQAEEFGGNSEAVKPQEVKPDTMKLTWRTPGYAVTDDWPVTQVNWNDAVAFCNWLSVQEKLDPCYQREGDTWMLLANANGYRLPTEAEWEYCCRAGTTTQFSFGDDWKGMDQFGWSKNNASGGPQSVGLRSANPFGLYDMHGNVWEWCHDGYDAKWYEKSPQDDPVGPIGALRRVDRGGSWSGVPAFGRSAFRISSNLIYRYDDRGFRILRVLDAVSATANKPWA